MSTSSRLKEYGKKQVTGQLETAKVNDRRQFSLRPASLSFSKDGLLRYGDHIMLLNKKTDGFLGKLKRIAIITW
jgi:hypothetical protein